MGFLKILGIKNKKDKPSDNVTKHVVEVEKDTFTFNTHKVIDEITEEQFKKVFLAALSDKLLYSMEYDYPRDEKYNKSGPSTIDKIIEKIDWTQLTPTLQAMLTKELADKLFSGMRGR